MGKHFYGLMLFYTPNEDLSQIRFREKIINNIFAMQQMSGILDDNLLEYE